MNFMSYWFRGVVIITTANHSPQSKLVFYTGKVLARDVTKEKTSDNDPGRK